GYQINALANIVKARRDLLEGNDVCRGFVHFDLVERGKRRHISAVHYSERVIHKSLTQNVLVPCIQPRLIHSNSANIKGRGIDYALDLLKRQLVRHYRKYGESGYILLMDFSDYFANISHAPIKAFVEREVVDSRAVALAHHLTDAQGHVGLGLGSEPNQILAVAFPDPIDHFVVEMCGVEAYGRYMDDSYAIHDSKEYLQVVRLLAERKCAELGIVVNPKKTQIVKLSKGFTFLKKRIYYSDTGRVVMNPCREAVTRQRRRMKKQAALYRAGRMTYEQARQSYQSWRGSMLRLDAHRTVLAMDALFKELFDGK
ncbi:MAG: RNA-directed DNA polymerase, partial [Gordonibacter sp.]